MMEFLGTFFVTVTLFASPSASLPGAAEAQRCEFQCKSKGVCIPMKYVCDGANDCADGSDEIDCQGANEIGNRNGSNSVIARSSYNLNSYSKSLTSPLNGKQLEYLVDYKAEDKDILARHSDFDPSRIFKLLTETASSTSTPPDQFHEEMIQLIASELAINQYNDLLAKYNVTPEANGPDSVTLFRLRMMFPHYCDLGQKPFFSAPRVFVSGRFEAPAMLQYPEFGGLIPRSSKLFENPETRNNIIYLHIYLMGRARDETVPRRVRCLTLKERIEKSMLSDDRRMRFLQNNDILSERTLIGGSFICNQSPSASHIEDCIPLDFKETCDKYF